MKLSILDILIIITTLITAVIHLSLGGAMFILNGVGYLALLAAYLLPNFAQWRGWIRWLFIGYAVLTIVLYFVFNAGDWQSTLGLVTKADELILIVLLLINRR
jgi:hypothetical protein